MYHDTPTTLPLSLLPDSNDPDARGLVIRKPIAYRVAHVKKGRRSVLPQCKLLTQEPRGVIRLKEEIQRNSLSEASKVGIFGTCTFSWNRRSLLMLISVWRIMAPALRLAFASFFNHCHPCLWNL